MILESLFCLSLIILYKIILKPLVSIFKLKAQFKDTAIVSYFPVFGDVSRGFQVSLRKYGDMLELFRQRHINNPNVKFILSNLFGEPLIEIIDPEYSKECFLKHENYKQINFIGHNKLGKSSIVYQNGQKWKKSRTIISSVLMDEKLSKKSEMMNEVVANCIEKGIGISIYKFLSTITGEIVCKIFFGNNVEMINGKQTALEIVQLMNEIGDLQIKNPYYFCKIRLFGQKSWNILPTSQEQQLVKRIDQIYDWTTETIKQKILNYNPLNQQESIIDAFIGEYLRSDTMNIDEMISQFLMLLFAGSDTTATLIAHCLYFLALHPQDQQQLLIEINAITKQRNVVREQDISKLINLQAFIYEVLRFKSPNFSPILRQVTKTHFVRDLKLEKGWYVLQPTQLPLLNEYYIPNSEIFDYKRWLKISPVKNDNGFVFIPFGAGPRVCIGQQLAMMETKIVLTHILKKFKVSLDRNVVIDWKIKFLYQMEPDTALTFELREQ